MGLLRRITPIEIAPSSRVLRDTPPWQKIKTDVSGEGSLVPHEVRPKHGSGFKIFIGASRSYDFKKCRLIMFSNSAEKFSISALRTLMRLM